MTTDLHQKLRDSGADLTLDVPVTDIVGRGDRLRRRRHRTVAAGGVAAVVVGATALSVTLSQETSPLLPQANAAWGPELVNLPASELTTIAGTCREALGDAGWRLPADVAPFAADERGGVAMVYFQHAGQLGDCWLVQDGGAYAPRSTGVAELEELPPGFHVDFAALSYSSGTVAGPASDGAGAVRVSDQVDRLEVEVAGVTREAMVAGGVALFWLPDGISQQQTDDLAVTAYDAEGTVLVTGVLADLPDPSEPEPNDDQDR